MKILGILICFCLFSTNMNDSIVKLDTRSTNPSIYLTKIIKSLNKSKFVTQTVHFQELNTSTNKNVTINEMIDTNQYKYGFSYAAYLTASGHSDTGIHLSLYFTI